MTGGLTLAAAARMMRDAVRDRGYRATPLGQEVGRFMRWMRSAEMADRSRQEYESVLYRFALAHADLELRDLAPPVGTERVEEWIDREFDGAAAGTRRKVLSILGSFFRWAYERDRIAGNPMLLVRRPRRRLTVRQAHPVAELAAIVAAQPQLRDRVALLLMARLGLRKNELRLLRVADVDLHHRHVRVRHGKGGTDLPVPLPDDLAQPWEEHVVLDGRGRHEPLLYPQWGRTIGGEWRVTREARDRPLSQRGMHEWWQRCLRRADVPHFPMHELRHSAGTHLYRATGDLEATRKLLRHRSIRTTADTYLHLDDRDVRQALAAAARLWTEEPHT